MPNEKRDEYGLSAEDIRQIQEYLRVKDITSGMTLQRQYEYTGKSAETFVAVKRCIAETWEKKLYADFGIKRPMKNYSEDFPVKKLGTTDADIISDILVNLENNPEQLDTLLEQFTEMYSDRIAEMLEVFGKSKNKTTDNLTKDELGEFAEIISDPLYDAFMHVLMVGQKVPELYNISHVNLSYEYFSNVPNNWDKMNFEASRTHCKTKLGAPLSLEQLMEEDYDAYERAVSFFESSPDSERYFEQLRESFLDTLNGTDRRIYELREQNFTESEIAYKLNYKTHSAVSKRIKAIGEKLQAFLKDYEDRGL